MSRSSHKVHERRIARESALALLYSSDITELDVARIVEEGSYPAGDIEFPEYAEALVTGVARHCKDIDERLKSTSENWALDRMPVVDRAILRLATYEMLYEDDVPISVTINEAVELAKAYGGEDDSSRFVNGVLGRIARLLEAEQAAPSAGADVADLEDAPKAAAGGEATAAEPEEASEEGGAEAPADAEPATGVQETEVGADGE